MPLLRSQGVVLSAISLTVERITAQLGGMDQAVKAYFFSLSPVELTAILDDYQRAYGSKASEYATDTIPKWRTGRVQMSGMVAERLFNLLPPRMPLGVKYKLVEGLWHHVGPSSKHRIRVGADANVAEVIELGKVGGAIGEIASFGWIATEEAAQEGSERPLR